MFFPYARKRAAKTSSWSGASWSRHNLNFATYEGTLTLEEYLVRVVFYQKRPFTRAEFRRFMFGQSKPYPQMIETFAQFKVRHGLKIAVVSNEARELYAYRIRKLKLDRFVDAFISSCFVHLRKPDADIFRLALDIAQVPARQVLYIEVRPGRGEFRDSKHSSRRLRIHPREVGFVRIAEQRTSIKLANSRILTIKGGSSSIKFAIYQASEPLQRRLYGSPASSSSPKALALGKPTHRALALRMLKRSCAR